MLGSGRCLSLPSTSLPSWGASRMPGGRWDAWRALPSVSSAEVGAGGRGRAPPAGPLADCSRPVPGPKGTAWSPHLQWEEPPGPLAIPHYSFEEHCLSFSEPLSATPARVSLDPLGGLATHACPLQPTVRFAEDTLLLPGDDGGSEEGPTEAPWAPPAGRQRLTRKDTPHYKKHFRVSRLPQPEAVVALLQGAQPDSEGPAGTGGWHNGPHTPWAPRAEDEGDKEDEEEVVAEEEEEKEEAVASVPSVKVGLAPPPS